MSNFKKHGGAPVIPEIAKAYENDPRTKLALSAIAAGTAGSPVAAGGYGYADGIARALQATVGGYMNKKQMEKYNADEAETIAQRQARGQDGLTGGGLPPPTAAPAAPMAPTAPQAAPPQAAAIASALGAPPAAAPPSAPATVPPVMPVSTPPILPANTGGGPTGQRPFGQGSSVARGPSFLQAPTQEAVPDAPAPVAKPAAVEAVGPTRSKLLDAAYRIMADGNPYESASGQDLYASGLSEQDKLNESAAERRQRLLEADHETESRIYADAATQDRSAAIRGREDVIARNAAALNTFKEHEFQYGVHKEDQAFTAGENAKNRANERQIAAMRVKSMGGGSSAWGLNADEEDAINKAAGEGRVDVTRLNSRTAKIMARIFMANPGFDAMTNHGQAALIGNAPAQQKAMMAAQLPAVLANVRDAGKKIKLSDVQFVGKLQAYGKGQLNDPDFIGYMNNRNDAMMMIAQVMRGTGATDKAVQMENDAAPKTMSPRAWDAWYSAQMKSLAPRIQMMERRKLLPEGTAASLGETAPGGAPSGSVVPRKPGESISAYLARTGG